MLGTALDLTLFLVCFSTGWALSGMELYPDLRNKLRNAFHLAKRDGYIRKDSLSLTQEGIDRLVGLLPKLRRHPVWSGSLWLVTYDLVENRHPDRDALRRFLIDQGYGKLQRSVYVTPFDPTDIIHQAINDLGLKGEVLISRMGTDGHIGEMSTQELIKKVYRLEPIVWEYRHFINQLTTGGFQTDELALIFLPYLAILKKDPQLPLELLPQNWPGEKARQQVTKDILPVLAANNLTSEKVLKALNFIPGRDYWTE